MLKLESNGHIQALAYQIQKEGNTCNGDSFYFKATEDYFICVVADGLGSGEGAHASSNAIREVVEKYHYEEVEVLMNHCNQVLKDKRGATVGILKVDFNQKKFTYCSVGNIEFLLHCPSGNFIYPIPVLGYLSGRPQKYRVQTYSYEEGAKFIIHSDGIAIPGIKKILSGSKMVEDIAYHLEKYTKTGADDLTYIVGQLF